MKKSLAQKVMLFLAVTIITITLLQSFSLAKSENVQMIKKKIMEIILHILMKQYTIIILTEKKKHIYG